MTFSKITDKQRADFAKLKSIHSKMNFWLEEFKIPYYFWSRYSLSEINDFLIICKDSDEIEALNRLIFEQYEERDFIANNPLKLLNLNAKKESFKKNISQANNLILFKNLELKQIEKEIDFFKNSNKSDLLNIESFFDKAYDDLLCKNTPPDYSLQNWELPHLIALENGYRYAEYYLYVENFKADSFNAGLDLKDKMLILKYLGVLDLIDGLPELSMNMKGRLLSSLLEENQTNIEKSYRSIFIQNIHPDKNKKKVISFLENLKMTSLADEIKKQENFID